MSRLRRLVLAVGIVSVLGGVAVVAAPGLALGSNLNPSSVAIGAVGLLALLAGLTGVRNRLRASSYEADLPDPERRVATIVPGADADTALNTLSGRTYTGLRNSRTLRERIRSAGIDVLAREGYTETEAEAALEEGTWTDDPHAATFFSEGRSSLPVWIRVRDLLGRESAARIQAHHAIDALAHRLDADGSSSSNRAYTRTDNDRRIDDGTRPGDDHRPRAAPGDSTRQDTSEEANP